MQTEGLVGEIMKYGLFGFSVSHTYELYDTPLIVRTWKRLSPYVMANFEPPSGDHERWLIDR